MAVEHANAELATGIGLETSKAFAAAGAATIVLVARHRGPMTEAKKSIEAAFPSTTVVTHAVSVEDTQQINALMEGLGTIDIMVLNAGFLHKPKPILEIDSSDLAKAFAVNMLGPLNMIKAFMKLPPRDVDSPRTIIYTSAWYVRKLMGKTVPRPRGCHVEFHLGTEIPLRLDPLVLKSPANPFAHLFVGV